MANADGSMLDVARWAQERLVDADGVGVTVKIGDELVFVATSTFAGAVDAVQHGLREGPCVTAVEAGVLVRSTAIGAGEQRWSRFALRAADLGLRSAV